MTESKPRVQPVTLEIEEEDSEEEDIKDFVDI
jgi:hypothetical protein